MPKAKILIVDDDPQIRLVLGDRLKANGFQVIQAEDGIRGLEQAEKEKPDLIFLDLQMPKMDGMETLKHLSGKHPEIIVIILTAYGSIERAVQAVKMGAYDFLPKPCQPDHILLVVEKALEQRKLREENQYLRGELESKYSMVIGQSKKMREIMEVVQKVARSKTNVLIEGESGTGKQLLARAIHNLSDRKQRPFIQVNCTTLSEQLLESDLFGHEKGAFTGAIKEKAGRFELADGGTVFLDEIGDLSPGIQGKLLHVIEYGEFQRVGGTKTIGVDVRILAATNKDLAQLVKEGKFREDLFYRLNVITIHLPPLRERAEDIPLFAEHFLQKHSRAMQKTVSGIAPAAMEILQAYSWPGNIRELENSIERAVVLASGKELTPELFDHLTEKPSAGEIDVGTPLNEALIKFKRQYITRTLRHTGNNQTAAARLLNIQRTYLNRLIKELGIGSGEG